MAKRKNSQKRSAKSPKERVDDPSLESRDKAAETKSKNMAKGKAGDKPKKFTPKKGALKNGEKGPGWLQKTRQFFREVRIELKKVTWPSRKETLASTSVVLILVFLVAVYLGLVDVILSRAVNYFLR